MPTLHGDLVVLRPLRVEDVERVAEIQSEPAVARWWGPPDLDDLRRKADGRDEPVGLAIEDDGELVGFIQYEEENEPEYRQAAIDVFLAEHAHGRGLGTDAVRTLARHLVHD